MFGSAYRVATVYGIPIRLHLTLVLLLPLLVMDFGLALGLVYGTALLASIVLHELGHSVVAIRKGCRVREILLLPIGGAAQMESMPRRPWDEFLMAVAGPAVSLALFAVLFFGGAWLPLPGDGPFFGIPPLNAVQELGILNGGLAVFNLLPAFPMDGGRVLRALLAQRWGRLKATRVAARVGRLIALLMIATSGYNLIYHHCFSMLLVVGIFVYWAAGAEYRLVRYQEWQRLQGWGDWSWQSAEAPDDNVVISPPPFRSGPSEEAPLRPMRGWRPFRRSRD